jgi:uncharacterized membrane protein
MADSRERYLASLSDMLAGSRRDRRRLREELEAHLNDARERGLGDDEALARIGSAADVAAAWNARCARRRAQQHVRAVSVAAVAAAACLLGIVQYARGAPSGPSQPPQRTIPHPPPPAPQPRQVGVLRFYP